MHVNEEKCRQKRKLHMGEKVIRFICGNTFEAFEGYLFILFFWGVNERRVPALFVWMFVFFWRGGVLYCFIYACLFGVLVLALENQ